MKIVKSTPYLSSMFNTKDFFGRDFFGDLLTNAFGVNALPVDDGKNLILTVDVPGLDEKDIKIEIKDDTLIVSGESKTVNCYRSVSKSTYLGDDVDTDKITASLEKGILTVTIPKKEIVEEKTVVKTIPISTK